MWWFVVAIWEHLIKLLINKDRNASSIGMLPVFVEMLISNVKFVGFYVIKSSFCNNSRMKRLSWKFVLKKFGLVL